MLDVSSESSARQRIHMKNQALFSAKDKSKKLKSHLLQFLFGALRVKDRSSRCTEGTHQRKENSRLSLTHSVHVQQCNAAALPTPLHSSISKSVFLN